MDVARKDDSELHGQEIRGALSHPDEAEGRHPPLVAPLPAITYAEGVDSRKTFSISPQLETILGYTPEEWFGDASRWEQCVHPDDRARVVSSCRLANERREPWCEEYRMIARDGRIVWIRDEAVLVRGSSGEPLCWQGVMVDITAQRTAIT
jgi:PAS domain S-box-containing protein